MSTSTPLERIAFGAFIVGTTLLAYTAWDVKSQYAALSRANAEVLERTTRRIENELLRSRMEVEHRTVPAYGFVHDMPSIPLTVEDFFVIRERF